MTKRKSITCSHYEVLVGYIGTCVYCGQVKDYDPDYKKPRVLKRGSIGGIPTTVKPPEIKTEDKPAWATPQITDRIGTRRVRDF